MRKPTVKPSKSPHYNAFVLARLMRDVRGRGRVYWRENNETYVLETRDVGVGERVFFLLSRLGSSVPAYWRLSDAAWRPCDPEGKLLRETVLRSSWWRRWLHHVLRGRYATTCERWPY